MKYFIDYEDIKEIPCLSLINDFHVALKREDFEICQLIKDEFERRNRSKEIDKKKLKELLFFCDEYIFDDLFLEKNLCNKVFSKYI